MASVLFSTVGQAIGGPLGAGIGAAVGATVDRSLFRKPRRGAEDGFASRSAYGEIVPLLFGRTRIGGHLIWATPPAAAGEKGQGRRAQSTSFAMAVSRGPIVDVGRIWADGSLLRTSDGKFLIDTGFRIHSRGGDAPDPLIVAAEGVASAPAYRHLSYLVFEGFDLGPFGNRIPSLSFEVLADGGTPQDWLGQMAAPLDPELDLRSGSPSVSGYTAWFDPFRDDVAALLGATGARTGAREGRIAFVAEPRVWEIATDDIIAGSGDGEGGSSLSQDPRPAGVGLSFQDSDRDYQLGWQQEMRGGRGAALSVSWPAASTAATARAIAVRLFQDAEAGTEKLSLGLPHRFLTASLGDTLSFGDGVQWLIVGRDVRGLSVELEARRLARPTSGGPVPTDAGRILQGPSILSPPSVTVIVEPPIPIFPSFGAGSILVAVSGAEGWQGADVRLLQGGDEVSIGSAVDGPPFGVLAARLGDAPTVIWDERATLLVDVAAGRGEFMSRGRRDVLDGGGLVSVGQELIQYREATIVGPGLVRLSGLLRGRFGTLPTGAPAGALVMALPPSGGAWMQVAPEAMGRQLTFLIDGAGDPAGGLPLVHRVLGAGMSPMAPVHVRSARLPDGTLQCSWVERSRAHWERNASMSTGSGQYVWHFQEHSGPMRALAASMSGIHLEPADQIAAFGAPLAAGRFRVEARGDGPEMLRFTQWVAI
jgi:hypothetical protein